MALGGPEAALRSPCELWCLHLGERIECGSILMVAMGESELSLRHLRRAGVDIFDIDVS